MGWHTRHASTRSGLEGHLRPETLNLTAWNHALGLLTKKKNLRKISEEKVLYVSPMRIYVLCFFM
jgi:hypothetical protein